VIRHTKHYNKILQTQTIWHTFNDVGLSLHGEGNFSLNDLRFDTQNIVLVDPVFGYPFRCGYKWRQDDP